MWGAEAGSEGAEGDVWSALPDVPVGSDTDEDEDDEVSTPSRDVSIDSDTRAAAVVRERGDDDEVLAAGSNGSLEVPSAVRDGDDNDEVSATALDVDAARVGAASVGSDADADEDEDEDKEASGAVADVSNEWVTDAAGERDGDDAWATLGVGVGDAGATPATATFSM